LFIQEDGEESSASVPKDDQQRSQNDRRYHFRTVVVHEDEDVDQEDVRHYGRHQGSAEQCGFAKEQERRPGHLC
jgi:hypothetical protein